VCVVVPYVCSYFVKCALNLKHLSLKIWMFSCCHMFFWAGGGGECSEPLFVNSCTVHSALHVSVVKTGIEFKGVSVTPCYRHAQSPL